MKINCLSCGFKIDLDEVYDDFSGQIKCFACGALLELVTSEGRLGSVKLACCPSVARPEEVES